jgi:hypothetical protein
LPEISTRSSSETRTQLRIARRPEFQNGAAASLLTKGFSMLGIPRRYAHFIFGVIQSGLTSCIAAAIASHPFLSSGGFLGHWLRSWLIAWGMMLPVVILAAPLIRALAIALTRNDEARASSEA